MKLSGGKIKPGLKDRGMTPDIPALNDPGFQDFHNEKPPRIDIESIPLPIFSNMSLDYTSCPRGLLFFISNL
jgi:hypothetical protein